MLAKQPIEQIQHAAQQQWEQHAEFKEYMSAVNPPMPKIDVVDFPHTLHEDGASRVIPFDLSQQLQTAYPATTPNLMANFIRVCEGTSLLTDAKASSQMFYVIRGKGRTQMQQGKPLSGNRGIYSPCPQFLMRCTAQQKILHFIGSLIAHC
jgi:hypothetical protein